MTHRITLERNLLRFAAAHFTTAGGDCEPLHGHNYDLFLELRGDLTADAWVLDFVQVKQIAAAVCRQLDHRFLLPLKNPTLRISQTGGAYEIHAADRRYVIPAGDVAALPIDNSTAERLAEWIAHRLAEELRAASNGAPNLESLTVGVEEAPGQAGWFRLDMRSRPG